MVGFRARVAVFAAAVAFVLTVGVSPTVGAQTTTTPARVTASPAGLLLDGAAWWPAGVNRGRKRILTDEPIIDLRERVAAGVPKARLAQEFGISRETVYQYLRAETDPAAG